MTDNDDLPTQELPEVLMGDAEEILLDLIDLISKAANVPLSSTPRRSYCPVGRRHCLFAA